MTVACFSIGSNLGDARCNVSEAIDRLGKAGRILRRSGYYLTAPWGITDQPHFINVAVQVETELPPRELLHLVLDIESEMGRATSFHWGPRLIDIDILVYGDLKIDEPDLHIPHPFMYERAFVLVPLAEIDERFIPFRISFRLRKLQACACPRIAGSPWRIQPVPFVRRTHDAICHCHSRSLRIDQIPGKTARGNQGQELA